MSFFKGKTVLVTGAGGSIGSALCERLEEEGVGKLILFDNSELALHNMTRKVFGPKGVQFVLGDVSDHNDVERLFYSQSFDFIFHAAAYKHVTLCEQNPGPAWRVNVQGTINLLGRAGCARFILVSTDKAVSPTCVMGRTKRAAEVHTRCRKQTTVRLGNVWGSSGSVVPLWKEQIAEGLPVTVTHPDATRYFITPSAAVRAILAAAELARGGETFVAQMGEARKIVDVARDLGAREFKYIGLRPGEKLHEELFVGRPVATESPWVCRDVAA